MSDDFKAEVNEDNLSARLSGGAIHLLSDALVSCFKGSGAINHLECSFEDLDDEEQYTMLMQKKSGITQGEKIDQLQQDNAELRETLQQQREKIVELYSIGQFKVRVDVSEVLTKSEELLNKND